MSLRGGLSFAAATNTTNISSVGRLYGFESKVRQCGLHLNMCTSIYVKYSPLEQQQPPSRVHPYRTHNHQSDIVPLFTPTSQRMQLLRVFFFFFILLQLAISWPYEWRKTKRERDRRLYHGEAAAHPPSIAAHCDAQSERVTTKPNCYVTDSLLQHHRRLTSAGCAALQCTPVCTTNSHMIRIATKRGRITFRLFTHRMIMKIIIFIKGLQEWQTC